MLNILFVETSLELVPKNISRHPSVTRNAKREDKRPEEILLDRSLHHRAMNSLPDSEKRGRPDIIQFCLLEALGSPLNKHGKLMIKAHTLNDMTLDFSPLLRLPRDCNRFKSLIEQLFELRQVPPAPGEPLITLREGKLSKIKEEIDPSRTFTLTSHGRLTSLEDVCKILVTEKKPLVFIGAFPHGAMRPETLELADEIISIYPDVLEAWVVTSRLIYEFERASGLL